MYMNQANKCLTGEVRLSYVHLAAPYANPQQPNAEPKYSVTLLIPKSDTVTYQDIQNAIQAAIQAAVNGKAWNGVRPPIIPVPIHDGDGVKQDGTPYGPECKGHWVMTASRRAQDGKPWCAISPTRLLSWPRRTAIRVCMPVARFTFSATSTPGKRAWGAASTA